MKTKKRSIGFTVRIAVIITMMLLLSTACSNPAGNGDTYTHNFIDGVFTGSISANATTIPFHDATCTTCGTIGIRQLVPNWIIDLATATADYQGTVTLNAQAGDIVLIKGSNPSQRAIVINNATEIYIANDTVISGTGPSGSITRPALQVPANTTIYGGGSGITISGGVYDAGIRGNGDLTISGVMGNITGGNPYLGLGGQPAIRADNTGATLTINGIVGDLTGGVGRLASMGGVTGPRNAGPGIQAVHLVISGTTGTISGGDFTVENETGNAGHGIVINSTSGTISITEDAVIGDMTAASIQGGTTVGTGNNGSQIQLGLSTNLFNDWNGSASLPYTKP